MALKELQKLTTYADGAGEGSLDQLDEITALGHKRPNDLVEAEVRIACLEAHSL